MRGRQYRQNLAGAGRQPAGAKEGFCQICQFVTLSETGIDAVLSEDYAMQIEVLFPVRSRIPASRVLNQLTNVGLPPNCSNPAGS